MLVVAKGNCPKCGKSYSEFGTVTEQEISFHCESCNTRYELCPDCQRQVPKLCIKCGGKLLNSLEYLKAEFGSDGLMIDFEKYVRYFVKKDVKHRYASFDLCYSYFYRVHKLNESKNEDKEKSCMVLWSYLASWGMLRGSSPLLQKSPAFLLPLINYIEKKYDEAINIDVDKYNKENIEKLIVFYEDIKKILSDDKFIPSVTLVTKIMLGVFANVPAYDRYVKSAFDIKTFNENSLSKINDVYMKNKSNVDNLAQQLKVLVFPNSEKVEIAYTKAKIIDMYGFQIGLNK